MSTPGQRSQPQAAAGVRRERAWLAAILVLALLLRLVGFTDPWSGRGFKSAFATVTTGCNARVFYEHGFAESKLMPSFWRVELQDGSVEHEYYTHHPALVALVGGVSLKLFGVHEWALTLPYLLCSLLSILATWKLAREWLGERAALLAAFFLAVVPLSSWYGTLAWIDGLTITFHALAALCWLRWLRTGSNAHLLRGALCVFGSGLCDWTGALILPGLAVHALFVARARGLSWLWSTLLFPAGFALAALLHKLHLALVLPPTHVEGETSGTLGWVTGLTVPLAVFLRAQLGYFAQYLTWPGLCLLGLALLAQLARVARGRASLEDGLLLALLPPGLLYVGLFPARSVNHDFFVFLSLPWMALSFAQLWEWGAARLEPLGHAVRAAGWALLLSFGGWCAWRVSEIADDLRGAAVCELVASAWLGTLLADPGAVIVANTGSALSLPFYSRAPILSGIDTPEKLEALRARVLARVGPGRRVVFLYDLQGLAYFPALRDYLKERAPAEEHLEQMSARPPLAFELYDIGAWVRAAPESAPAGH